MHMPDIDFMDTDLGRQRLQLNVACLFWSVSSSSFIRRCVPLCRWHAPKYSAAETYCKMPAYYNISTSFDNHEHCPMAFERPGCRLRAAYSNDSHMHAITNVGRKWLPNGTFRCVRQSKRSTCDFSEKKTVAPDVTEPRSPGARNNVHTAPFSPAHSCTPRTKMNTTIRARITRWGIH